MNKNHKVCLQRFVKNYHRVKAIDDSFDKINAFYEKNMLVGRLAKEELALLAIKDDGRETSLLAMAEKIASVLEVIDSVAGKDFDLVMNDLHSRYKRLDDAPSCDECVRSDAGYQINSKYLHLSCGRKLDLDEDIESPDDVVSLLRYMDGRLSFEYQRIDLSDLVRSIYQHKNWPLKELSTLQL